MVRADLGLSPWQVFHQGVATRTGLAMGTVTILTGIVVLLGWIPLRERFGLGSLLNVALIGNADLPEDLGSAGMRWSAMTGGIILIGIGSALYIGTGLGPGPRDGLMTGLARRGLPIGAVRTALEITVLVIGWLLGGTVGLGTIAFALTIGPVIAFLLPLATIGESPPATVPDGKLILRI